MPPEQLGDRRHDEAQATELVTAAPGQRNVAQRPAELLVAPFVQAAVLSLVDRGLLDVHRVLDASAIRVELANSELFARHKAGDFKPDPITLARSIRWGATA